MTRRLLARVAHVAWCRLAHRGGWQPHAGYTYCPRCGDLWAPHLWRWRR